MEKAGDDVGLNFQIARLIRITLDFEPIYFSESLLLAAKKDEPTRKAPVEPTNKTKVDPTSKPAVEPTSKTPVEPANKAKVDPTNKAPVEPASKAKVEPTNKATVEPANKAKVEPTNKAAVEPASKAAVEPTRKVPVEPEIPAEETDKYKTGWEELLELGGLSSFAEGFYDGMQMEDNSSLAQCEMLV